MALKRSTMATLFAAGLLAGGVAVAGVLGNSGALAAGGASPSPSPSASPGPGQHWRGGERGPHGVGPGMMGGPMGGMMGGLRGLKGDFGAPLHGEFVVEKPGGGTQTMVMQSGAITAKGSDSVTVKSTDGFTLKWTVNSSTLVFPGGTPATGPNGKVFPSKGSLSDLTVGEDVVLTGTKSSGGATATFVGRRPANGDWHFRGRGPNPSGSPSPSSNA